MSITIRFTKIEELCNTTKLQKNIEQIEKVFSTPEEITDNIQSVMKRFGISQVINPLNALKRSGTDVSIILTTLNILLFLGKDSIWSYFLEKKQTRKTRSKRFVLQLQKQRERNTPDYKSKKKNLTQTK